MYNQKKYLAHKIGSIISIVLGALILISLLFTIISVFKVCDKLEGSGLIGLMIGLVLRGYLGYIFIKFGKSTMEEPVYYKKENESKAYWIYPSKKQTATLIILGALLFILGIAAMDAGGIISSSGNYYVSIKVLDWAQWIQNLSALGIAVCKIVALMLPDEEAQTTTEKTSNITTDKKETLEEKINELKRLKESGVITEEQYEEGVKNLISK